MEITGMEAFDTVSTINDSINDSFWNDKSIPEDIQKRIEENIYLYELEFISNGDDFCIEFLGMQLWNSEDDQREYDDDNDCYAELLESYIRKEMINVLSDLNLIKNYLTK